MEIRIERIGNGQACLRKGRLHAPASLMDLPVLRLGEKVTDWKAFDHPVMAADFQRQLSVVRCPAHAAFHSIPRPPNSNLRWKLEMVICRRNPTARDLSLKKVAFGLMTDPGNPALQAAEVDILFNYINALQERRGSHIGLDPGIHVGRVLRRDVDGRDKPGHDGKRARGLFALGSGAPHCRPPSPP